MNDLQSRLERLVNEMMTNMGNEVAKADLPVSVDEITFTLKQSDGELTERANVIQKEVKCHRNANGQWVCPIPR